MIIEQLAKHTDHKRTRSNDLSRFGVSTAPIDLLQEDTSTSSLSQSRSLMYSAVSRRFVVRSKAVLIRDAEKDHQLQSVWCALPDIS